MPGLGEFGAAERDTDQSVERDWFTYHGERFEVKPRVSWMVLGRFAKAAQAGADSDTLEGITAMHEFITACIHEGDVSRFEDTAIKHGDSGDELMAISIALYASVTGRPTERPSGSPDGSSTTTESSRGASSSGASLSPIQRDPRIQELVPVSKAGRKLLAGAA